MKITEKRLRQIIKETLLEEQYRIDESRHKMKHLKSAFRAAALSAGVTFTGAQLNKMVQNFVTEQPGIHVTVGSQFGGGMNIKHEKLPDGIKQEIDAFIENPNLKDAPKMHGYSAKYRKFDGAGRNTDLKQTLDDLDAVLKVLPGDKGALYQG